VIQANVDRGLLTQSTIQQECLTQLGDDLWF